MDRGRVIGNQGKLPWHLPAELQRFKRLTMGHHIIMGRKTWESIGRPLPGRTSVVITHDAQYHAPGALVARSLDDALTLAEHDPEPFVIGGAEIFREALPLATRIYLTKILADHVGDTWFPEFSEAQFQRVQSEFHPAQPPQPAWEHLIYERS